MLQEHPKAPQDGSHLGNRMWHRLEVLSSLCNHRLWFECLVEVSGVAPPHSSVRWRAHQSGSHTGIFSCLHDASAWRPHQVLSPRRTRETNNVACVNQDPMQLAFSSDKEPNSNNQCPSHWCQARGLRWRLRVHLIQRDKGSKMAWNKNQDPGQKKCPRLNLVVWQG
jgi:hypothetical protein